MTPKEALEKVKILLKQHFSAEEKEAKDEKFEEVTLPDGTKVKYDKLEAGGKLLVIAEDKTESPAPAGEYTLEGGKVLVVAEEGAITEVKEPAPVEQKMAEGDPATDPKAGIDWSTEIKWIKENLANAAKQIATLEAAMQMFKSNTSETFASVQVYMEALSGESTEDPIKKPRQTAFGAQASDKETSRQRMINAMKALSKKDKK